MGTLGTKRRGLSSVLYHASFILFLLILGALLVGAAWGLGEQAAKTTHQRRWNLFALCVAFAAIVSVSVRGFGCRDIALRRACGPFIAAQLYRVPASLDLISS